jgi:deoxyribonuclease-4
MISLNLGSHVSIRNGYTGAAIRTKAIGCTCFQYFPKNPRSIAVKQFDITDAVACAQFCQTNGIQSVAHSPYPTSLTVTSAPDCERMQASILNDLTIAEHCGSLGVVVHFGKYKSDDPLEGYRLMIAFLDQLLAKWPGKAKLLLENNAGQGIRMGTTFEELVQVRTLSQFPDKIGFCFDTCHAFASGLWQPDKTEEMFNRGEEVGYFEHVVAVHLNDSVFPSRSYRDRHTNIGSGLIGIEGFRSLLSYPFFRTVPLILETPKAANGSHEDEIRFVRQIFANDQ